MGDGAGRKEVDEEKVEDKRGDNGRKEEDGDEGGWRFLNVSLWSMKRRKSNGQNISEMGRTREREREGD